MIKKIFNTLGIIVSVIFLGLVILASFYFFDKEEVNFTKNNSKVGVPTVMAAETDNLAGYAWSDNIGWISFNCIDDNNCATSNYGVGIDVNGKLAGYAWSDNIGWISFNESDLGGCPLGACKARLEGNSAIRGWAKALSATGNGWDGWISLGKQPSESIDYGAVLQEDGSFQGYAWGDEVVGWIAFSTNFSQVEFRGGTPIINTFEVGSVTTGEKPTADWSGENIVSCDLASDTGYNEGGVCSGIDCLNVSNFLINKEVLEETKYTLTCFNEIGADDSFEYTALAGFELVANPATVNIDFVAGGATTTSSAIGVNPLNGFSEDVSFSADLNEVPASPTGDSAVAIFSKNIMSFADYSNGGMTMFRVFAPYRFVGKKTVQVYGNGYEFANIIIDAGNIDPAYEEI